VDGDDERAAAGRGHGKAGGVDDLAGDAQARPAEPVPQLVAHRSGRAAEVLPPADHARRSGPGGERHRLDAGARQPAQQRPHVPPDPPGDGLQQLTGVDGDGRGGHRRSP
jgi:hypothetical protein